jgi:glycerol uptake operon antiterminator
MYSDFRERIEANPIIAAVKDDKGLELALTSDCDVLFFLYGDICSLPDKVDLVKKAGKTAMVHIDLINGLSSKEIAADYIKKATDADGIITTKNNLIPHAKDIGLHTILRHFVLDSMALVNIEKQSKVGGIQPDFIEILPGIVVPKMIKKINSISRVPIIAGGLITDKKDVVNALDAGATAISTTNRDVWFM